MKVISRFLLLSAGTLGLLASTQAAVETYKIDPVHSSVGFAIRHFFTNVPGAFTKFSGTITVDRDHLENSSVAATIEVPSVDTRTEKRDNHLRSPDFFDAKHFPFLTFRSATIAAAGDEFKIGGDYEKVNTFGDTYWTGASRTWWRATTRARWAWPGT